MFWGVLMNHWVCLGKTWTYCTYYFQPQYIFFREIPLNNSRAIFTRACCFDQTRLHQIILYYLDKPILQYNCQTCLLKNKHLTRTCTQKFTTSKGEGGDFVSRAILRCGYIIYTYMILFIYVDIPFTKYSLCQVSSTSFVQSVRSSKLLLCCWVVKLSHRFTFASSWFLSRHSSYHVILELLGELTDLWLPRALRVTLLDISRHTWQRKK